VERAELTPGVNGRIRQGFSRGPERPPSERGPAAVLRRDQRIFVHVGADALTIERLCGIDAAVAGHRKPARRQGATVADACRRIGTRAAARRHVDAVALVREARADAEPTIRTVVVVDARFAALARALAAAEAVRAGRNSELFVPHVTHGRESPRAGVDRRVALHRADLVAAPVAGADLVGFARAVRVGLARAAEVAQQTHPAHQRKRAAEKFLAVPDLVRVDTASVVRSAAETAGVLTRRPAAAGQGAFVARRAIRVRAAARAGAVRIQISGSGAHARESGRLVAFLAGGACRAVLTAASRLAVVLAKLN